MIPKSIKILLLILLIILSAPTDFYSQNVDIIPYLKKIENGKVDEVKNELTGLKERYPESPSVMFLEGVLTENGQKAVVIYQTIVDQYPESKYADAALYRIFSYYYALGLYESAREKLEQLKVTYPESPYIKMAMQNQLPVNPEITKEEGIVEQTDTIQQNIDDFPDQDYKYTIQAGAFSKDENAKVLKLKFERSGIYSEIKDKLVGGTTFHVVYVGKFMTENDAENFLKTINDNFDLSGRVVEIRR